MTWLIALSIVVTLLGVTLLVVGLRGRRIDDHPLCRACGFDLTGAPSTSARCPECGRATTNPRVGHRRRRAMPIAIGATLMAVVLLGGGTIGVGLARGVDWRDKLPTSWLLREATSGAVVDRAEPIQRLVLRDASSPLPIATRVALARAIIAVQPDATIAWQQTWGDWVAARIVDGTLPADARDAFVNELFADATVTLRPSFRQGNAPAVRIVFPQRDREVLSGRALYGLMSDGDRVLKVDGRQMPPLALGMNTTIFDVDLVRGGESMTEAADSSFDWRTIGVGVHTVEWSQSIRIVAGPASTATWDVAPAAMDARTFCKTSLAWRGTVSVVDADSDADVCLSDDPAGLLRAAIQDAAIRLSAMNGSAILAVRYATTLPFDLAVDVFVRQDGGDEQRVVSIARPASEAAGPCSWGLYTGRFHPGVAQLIFRASPAVARRTPDLINIWGGEMRIDDVPVIDTTAKAATKPTAPR